MDMDALFGDLLDDGPTRSRSQARPEAEAVIVRVDQSRMPPKTSKKRPQPLSEASNEDSASRRTRAYEAALGLGNRSWGDDVSLSSVSGYHNEDAEVEL